MKVKVNLAEDKSKRKFINSKGNKFKKPNHFHSYPHANSCSFKPSQSFSFKSKTFGQKTDGRFCYVFGRTPQYFNRKKEPVKAQPRGNGENS